MPEDIRGQRHDRTALILYGSETGNSEDLAEELGHVAERLFFKTRVSEMDLVEINELLRYTVAIFVISTTGQGEFPKNARKFWKSLLRKRLPPGCLSHVKFTTFGLGDSSYPKFNWSARKLHKRLEQLGAQEVYPRGEGDEQHEEGIDGTFLSWSLDLRKHLLSAYPLPEDVLPLAPDAILPFKYQLAFAENYTTVSSSLPDSDILKGINMESESPLRTQLKEQDPNDNPQIIDTNLPPADLLRIPKGSAIELLENKRVTPESHWQEVRSLTFVTTAENCGRISRGEGSGSWKDVYHEGENCGSICGETCRGRCENGEKCKGECGDTCRGKCRRLCTETYHPGDTVTIFPKNSPADVESLISHMGWDDIADRKVAFKSTTLDGENVTSMVPGILHFQSVTTSHTLRTLLTHNLDIMAIPKRRFFLLISLYTDNDMHKDRLLELSSTEFSDEYYDYATRPRRSILETLHEFWSVKIPWQDVTSLFPKIRGRQFSISSGGILKDYDQEGLVRLELLIAIVKYKTILKKVRQGLCSRYIASLKAGTTLNVVFESNQKFDGLARKHPEFPIIMIAPGTGVAPCRALIWERRKAWLNSLARLPNAVNSEIDPSNDTSKHDAVENNKVIKSGDKSPPKNFTFGRTLLFFGNRNKNADYFYHDEWDAINLDVFTAFSRDQREKIYIQDVIRKEGMSVNKLIREGAIIYVCGSSGNMPKAVKAALVDVMTKDGNVEEAEKNMEYLEREGRYIQETW